MTHWQPSAVSFSFHCFTSPTSQQLVYEPPEMSIMQTPFGFSGALSQSMYGLRHSSALKPFARDTSVIAAIWCGWASGIFPSGQM